MSWEALAWAVRQDPGSSPRKFVLIMLAERHNRETGRCYPSIDLLSKDTCLSRSTVKRSLDDLEESGYIKRTRRRRTDGTLGVYEYELLFEPGFTVHTPGSTVTPSPGFTVNPLNLEVDLEPNVSTDVLTPQRPKRKADPLWDVLVLELGEPATKSERGRRNKALAELREVGATPEQIRTRLQTYRKRWPGVDVTATALAANWTALGGDGRGHPQPLSRLERLQAIERERGEHEGDST